MLTFLLKNCLYICGIISLALRIPNLRAHTWDDANPAAKKATSVRILVSGRQIFKAVRGLVDSPFAEKGCKKYALHHHHPPKNCCAMKECKQPLHHRRYLQLTYLSSRSNLSTRHLNPHFPFLTSFANF